MDNPTRSIANNNYNPIFDKKARDFYEKKLSNLARSLETGKGEPKAELTEENRNYLQTLIKSKLEFRDVAVDLNSRKEQEATLKKFKQDVETCETALRAVTAVKPVNLKDVQKASENLEIAQGRLADLERGIEIRNEANRILQKAGPTLASSEELKKAVSEYKTAVKDFIEANPKLKTASPESIKKLKDKEQAVTDALKLVAEGQSFKDVVKQIRDTEKDISKLEKLPLDKNPNIKRAQEQNLIMLRNTLNKLETLRDVLLRHEAIGDNPLLNAKVDKAPKKLKKEFQKVQERIAQWGVSLTTAMDSLRTAVKSKKDLAEIEKNYGHFTHKAPEDQKALYSILDSASELQDVAEMFRGVKGLDEFKANNDANIASARKWAIGLAITVIFSPLALIAGLFLLSYHLQVKENEEALKELKEALGVVSKATDDLEGLNYRVHPDEGTVTHNPLFKGSPKPKKEQVERPKPPVSDKGKDEKQ